MRHYQCDSPEAAARIVAACLLSDEHVGADETEALDRHGIEQRLSLRPRQFLAVVQTLCEDLTSAAYLNWGDASSLDPVIVSQLAATCRTGKSGATSSGYARKPFMQPGISPREKPDFFTCCALRGNCLSKPIGRVHAIRSDSRARIACND
jgi:hypothetical protein